MIPKILHRTTRCFEKLKETQMFDYGKQWEKMGYELRNYTDADCDLYVENCLKGDELKAYKNLIPRVLKSDIWRLCVLYAEGGVYADIHIKPMTKELAFDENIDHVFVIDCSHHDKRVYNALIMARKESPLIMNILRRTLAHVHAKIYPHHVLDVTGPGVMGYVLRQALDEKSELQQKIYPYQDGNVLFMKHGFLFEKSSQNLNKEDVGNSESCYIIYKNNFVFKCRYKSYRRDMYAMGCDSRYENYFHRRIMYKDDLECLIAYLNGKPLEPANITNERYYFEKTMNDEYDLKE